MSQIVKRRPISVAVDLFCRDDRVTLVLRHGERHMGYHPIGKKWRTLRRGDTVRGPEGYEYTVKRLTLHEADPPIEKPVEIESVAAWATSGLAR